VAGHLAGCTECLERVKALAALSEDFESYWDSFGVRSCVAAYRQWFMVRALRAVIERDPAAGAVARQWLERMIVAPVAGPCAPSWIE